MADYFKKYDHLIYYPFRNRTLDKVDLLKPKSTFFITLIFTSITISWVTTVLVISFVQLSVEDIDKLTFFDYGIFTLGVACISSILSMLAINRLFRMYTLSIKSAFKVDYGHNYLKIEQGGMIEYEPEDDDELEEIKQY